MAGEIDRHRSGGHRQDPEPEEKLASPPAKVPAFAERATDLAALRDAVVDAANVGAGLWFSYLFVLFFLLVTVGGVTHRMLFFEDPVKLPILNVDLPLTAFFTVGPALFIVLHLYTLLHFTLLAGKVDAFDTQLGEQIPDQEQRTQLRRQLPSNIFAQYLAGPREVREGVIGFLLRLIASISLVGAPLILLILFQLQFLPYQDETITWWHRIVVAVDLIVLWTLWPSIALGKTTKLGWESLQHPKVLVLLTLSFASMFLVTFVAVFPGEWVEAYVPPLRLFPVKKLDGTGFRVASLRDVLVSGEVDYIARKPVSPWSNRLVLPGVDIMDTGKFDSEAKIASLSRTVILRARRLRGAVLFNANLKKADFTGAQLQGAMLNEASLNYGFLNQTQLDGADLRSAKLQGVQMGSTNLRGANLEGANLRAAILSGTDLRGASLFRAILQFAFLSDAKLQGADLRFASLEAASFDGSDLSGATLGEAVLHGVEMNRSTLRGVDLQGACAWRMNIETSEVESVFSRGIEWRHVKCGIGFSTFEDLRKEIGPQLPPINLANAEKRIAVLDCAAAELASCNPTASLPRSPAQETIEVASIDDTAYKLILPKVLAAEACKNKEDLTLAAAFVRPFDNSAYAVTDSQSDWDRLTNELDASCPQLARVWRPTVKWDVSGRFSQDSTTRPQDSTTGPEVISWPIIGFGP